MGNETRSAQGRSVARLVIADDHALSRAGLRNLLADEPAVEIVGEATNGAEAVSECQRHLPDLVLMDVRMPEMDGLTATKVIKRQFPRIVVLILTMHENPDYLFESLKAGAAGYVLKDATEEELIDAIERALGGESPLDQEVATRLLRRMIDESRQGESYPSENKDASHSRRQLEPLTAREIEVLRLMITGKTNRQIGEIMFLSANTVKTHVQHIIRKLNVSDRTQAATFAIEAKLLD